MDGLLFDTERIYRESWMILAEEFGQVPNPEFPKAVCGSSGEHMRDIIREYYPAVDASAFADACVKRVDAIVKVEVPEKPGIREILSYMKEQGMKIAVASSSSLQIIEHNLESTGIRKYFDAVVSGQEVKRGKPAPDIFELAASRLGLDPEDCYVFEDGSNGIHAGAAAGCTTVMIPDLTEPNEELEALAAGIYDSLLTAKAAIQEGKL